MQRACGPAAPAGPSRTRAAPPPPPPPQRRCALNVTGPVSQRVAGPPPVVTTRAAPVSLVLARNLPCNVVVLPPVFDLPLNRAPCNGAKTAGPISRVDPSSHFSTPRQRK